MLPQETYIFRLPDKTFSTVFECIMSLQPGNSVVFPSQSLDIICGAQISAQHTVNYIVVSLRPNSILLL